MKFKRAFEKRQFDEWLFPVSGKAVVKVKAFNSPEPEHQHDSDYKLPADDHSDLLVNVVGAVSNER